MVLMAYYYYSGTTSESVKILVKLLETKRRKFKIQRSLLFKKLVLLIFLCMRNTGLGKKRLVWHLHDAAETLSIFLSFPNFLILTDKRLYMLEIITIRLTYKIERVLYVFLKEDI